jgi:hypothetical protein
MGVRSSTVGTTGCGTLILDYEIVQGNQLRLTVSGSQLADIPDYVVQLMLAPEPPLPQLELELDLSNETALSPAGLALLMRTWAAVLGRRGELRLQGLQPMVREQLAAIGVPELTKSPGDPVPPRQPVLERGADRPPSAPAAPPAASAPAPGPRRAPTVTGADRPQSLL